MSGRSPDNWRGGRKTRQTAERAAAAQPSWKQSGRVGTGSRAKRPWVKMLLVSLALALLVALGIWIFRPHDQLHTHFVILDLLRDPANGAANSEFFDPITAPEIPVLPDRRQPLGIVTGSYHNTLKFVGGDHDGANLSAAKMVIVYLQTHIVPAADGSLLCLVKNSTPDLDQAASQSEPLTELKDSLEAVVNSGKRILLIVDELPSTGAWRLGDFRTDATQTIATWPTEDVFKNRLVVVASCSDLQTSAPGFVGADGRTAFGSIVMQALSSAADAGNRNDNAKKLDVAEFCDFVARKTQQWVRTHRTPEGQTVLVSPAIEELQAAEQKFVLLAEIPEPPVAVAPTTPAAVSELAVQWEKRDALNRKLAWRWRPLLWQSASEHLLRAQTAALTGNDEMAQQLLKTGAERLKRLEQATQEAVPSSAELNLEFGMPRHWFANLPSAALQNHLWPAAAKFDAAPEASPKSVIQQHLEDYPFDDLGIKPQDKAPHEVLALREQVEQAAGSLMSVAAILPITCMSLEQQCLSVEDRLFTAIEAQNSADDLAKIRQQLQSVLAFAKAHQRAELSVQRTLSCSESLAKWAADFPFTNEENFQANWEDLLSANLPTQQDNLLKLSDRAEAMAAKAKPGVYEIAAPLRANIFRLLCAARLLSGKLHPEESADGFSTVQLEELSVELTRLTDGCRNFQQSVDQGLATLCSDADRGLNQRAGTPMEMVLQNQQLRATVALTCLDSEQRARLIDKLVRLDIELAKSEGEVSEVVSGLTGTSRQQALWYFQHLNLFLDVTESSEVTAEIRRHVDTLVSATVAQQPAALAALGDGIRKFWKQCRADEANHALTTSDPMAAVLLRKADRLTRGFSAFDADKFPESDKVSRSVTGKLHTLWQVHYCLRQADRIIAGQWVLPKTKAPFQTNGWYAVTANQWLQAADDLSKNLSTTSIARPAFLATAFTQRTTALQDAGTWKIAPLNPLRSDVIDLGDHSRTTVDLPIELDFSPTLPPGIAALQCLPGAVDLPVSVVRNAVPLPTHEETGTVFVRLQRIRDSLAKNCTTVNFVPRVFYRGRQFSLGANLDVNPCPSAEFVIKRIARQDTGSINVSGADIRPIAFVLDFSGSMDDPLGNGERRVAVALDILEDIVGSRDQRNQASLRVFGHRRMYTNSTDRSKQIENATYEAAFGKQIPEIDPQDDIELEIPRISLGKPGRDRFADVIAKLRQSGPFGVTPLLQSLSLAMFEDLRNKPGIVIAITDGVATDAGFDLETHQPKKEFDRDDKTNSLKGVVAKNTSTKVIVVAFDFQNQDERQALETIMARCGIGRDSIVNAKNGRELQLRIENGLDPLSYAVTGRLMSRNSELGQAVHNVPRGIDYDVSYAELQPYRGLSVGFGDRLNLEVNWEERRFEFLRPRILANSKRAERPDEQGTTPWILCQLAAEIRRSPKTPEFGRVAMTLMLDHPDEFQPVRQPAEIEFRYSAENGYRAEQTTEQYVAEELGAPGYKIDITQWPTDQFVKVDAAWKMNRTPPEQVIPYAQLTSENTLAASGQLRTCQLSTTLKGDGTLEVRLDPPQPNADPISTSRSENAVQDIRIEIGSWGELKTTEKFEPDEVTTSVHRTEDGALIYRFLGEYTAGELQSKELAFTSRAARMQGAIRPATMTVQPTNVAE